MKVYLAMASYTGRPDVETQQSLVTSCLDLREHEIDVELKLSVGHSIIPVVRNGFVTDFLHSDCTDLVMVDDDLAWEDGALRRLLSHNVSVVGGAYPKRQDKLEFPVKRIPGEQVDLVTGLLKVKMLPAGFFRMTRECLELMVREYAHLKYFDRGSPYKYSHALFWNELDKGIDPDSDPNLPEVWGEDFTFCRRWAAMGGDIHLDTLLTFKHIGRKGWVGCYADTMPVSALFDTAE